jgi:hypothetical protein
MTPEFQKLLERYHDREVSPQESKDVEELLATDASALEYLGNLDEMTELVQTAIHTRLVETSFEGFWETVSSRINEQTSGAPAQVSQPSLGDRLKGWLQTIFVEHKSAWVTAAATAAAVALVLSFMGPTNVADQQGSGAAIVKVEKHIIYVDSVENPNKDSMVLVNSIVDKAKGETKIIWLLPNQVEEDQAEDNEDDGIEIVDEPL